MYPLKWVLNKAGQFIVDSTYLLLGQKLQTFKLTDLDENEITSNDLLGKPTLINFLVLANGRLYKKTLKLAALPRNLFIDKKGTLRHIENNYPLSAKSEPLNIDDPNNYFAKIIDKLIK